jgi:glutathione S-transferase
MLLRTSLSSPFGRKTRLAALRLGLMDGLKIETAADPLDPASALRQENPLGKIPVLTLDDGRKIFDSRVILEYFDHLKGGGVILPKEWNARLDTITLQALGDGIMDAAILVVYEGRHRPKEIHHEPWLAYQRGKIERGVAALAKSPPDAKAFNVGTISVACALGYMDWRKQIDWRASHPSLITWLDAFRANVPEFDATKAEG